MMTEHELKRNIGHPSGLTPIFQDMRALVAEVRRLRAELDTAVGELVDLQNLLCLQEERVQSPLMGVAVRRWQRAHPAKGNLAVPSLDVLLRWMLGEMTRLAEAKRGRTYTRPEFHVEEEEP